MTAGALDFAWPTGLIGRASGWSEKRDPFQTIAHPPISMRKDVALVPRWRALRVPVAADGSFDATRCEATDLLIKVSPGGGGRPGLSSGASSALVREPDGQVIRIKRCGFTTRGVGGRAGYVGRIGMMSIAEAVQECRMLAIFRAQGLCPACRPVSLDILADPQAPFFNDHAYAVARIAVTSDVRADEWFLEILKSALEAQGLERPVLEIRNDEQLRLRKPAEGLAALRSAKPYDRVAVLGRGLGGFLRAVHDAGLLRGRGSVWFGNDVVGPDLRLSAIDADGGALVAARGGQGLAARQRIEVAEYAAGFADCFSWGQSDWLAEASTVLCETFWEGYRGAAAANVAGSGLVGTASAGGRPVVQGI